MKIVKQEKFEQELIESLSLIIVYFSSSHCIACKLSEPFLLDLEKSYNVSVLKIDGERELKLVETFSIDTIPTFILFEKLTVLETIKGFRNKFDLEKAIRTYTR